MYTTHFLLPSPNSPAATQLPWHPPGLLTGGNDLPVHGLSPQRAPAQHGYQKGVGQGEAGPSTLREDFCGFQKKGGYILRSGGTKGTGLALPTTWALYCLYF